MLHTDSVDEIWSNQVIAMNGSLLDTRSLPIDATKLIPGHLQAMAAAPFASGTLKDETYSYRILSVGLGSAILGIFLHRQFDNVGNHIQSYTLVDQNN